MNLKRGILAFTIISVLGTLGHFLFEWTGENKLIGLFFPVNESVWEHLKLLFFPTVFYTAFKLIKEDNKPRLIVATAKSLYFGMFLIVALFYTYSGALGFKIDAINILIYYIAVLAVIISRGKFYNGKKELKQNSLIFSLFLIFVTAILFFAWTVLPPDIDLFIAP